MPYACMRRVVADPRAFPLNNEQARVGIERLGWHTFRHSYRSMLDACGAPIGVQQKLMRHAQVSTTMKYGNAYMTEKRKPHGAVVQMVLPARTNEKAEARSASA